jgi:hypothetical protein
MEKGVDRYKTKKYSKPASYRCSNTIVCENPSDAKYSRQNFQCVGALSLLHAMEGSTVHLYNKITRQLNR